MQPASAQIEPARRTREIEEFTNLYLIHPLSARLTPLFARLGIRPNTVSVMGMCSGLLAGWAYSHYPEFTHAVLGLVLMFAWHVLDGVDGQLARMTASQSEFGRIIDGVADNAVFAAVYVGLGLGLMRDHGPWVWLVIALAAAAHSAQAAVYEAQRQEYEFWGRARNSAELKSAEDLQAAARPGSPARAFARALGIGYARLQYLAGRVDPAFRAALEAALSADPERVDAIRRRYREVFAPLVRNWSMMSSNYRTIAIFLLAAAGIPLWYFLLEIVVLSPLTVLLVRDKQARCRAFAGTLDTQAR